MAFQCFSAIIEIKKIPAIKNGKLQRAAKASFQFFTNIITITAITVIKFGIKVVTAFSIISFSEFVSPIILARIFPEGTGTVNQKGIDFYNNLINELLKYNITPFITLYHWDLPYALYLKGGWLNKDSVDWFEAYAKVIAENFGDRVKNFITFNEPSVFMGCGYSQGVHAPGIKLGDKDLLYMGHNIHLAHGKAEGSLNVIKFFTRSPNDSAITFA